MPLRSLRTALMPLAASVALLAACGDDDTGPSMAVMSGSAEERRADEPPAAAGDGAAAPAMPRRRGPLVKLRQSQFGPVLFDGRERALYLFTRDPRRRSRCYGACAAAWPPFYAQGTPRAARGVDEDLLGTVKRRNGRRQVTYRGQPLYFYVDDPRGQVLCNDIVEFGGTWYALTADGRPPAS